MAVYLSYSSQQHLVFYMFIVLWLCITKFSLLWLTVYWHWRGTA